MRSIYQDEITDCISYWESFSSERLKEILARRLKSLLVQSPYRELYQALFSGDWAEAQVLIQEFEKDRMFTNASNQALARVCYHRFTEDPMPISLPIGFRSQLASRGICIKIQQN